MKYDYEKIAYKVGMRAADPDDACDCKQACENDSSRKSESDYLKEEIESLRDTVVAQAKTITLNELQIKTISAEKAELEDNYYRLERWSRSDSAEIYDLQKLVKKLITLIDKDTIAKLGLEEYVEQEK